jgi:hypothetical protein
MSDLHKALETQLTNIETRTGKSLAELTVFVQQSGLTKHGEIRSLLMQQFGLGYGDANTLAHYARQAPGSGSPAAPSASPSQVLDALYTGPKAALRPIHDQLMQHIEQFGDFEIAPKKTYLSLRRKKQFAMIGPATNSQVEVGLNVKSLPASQRLVEQPPKSMCNYKCRISDIEQVNDELISWIRCAYDEAG